MKRLAFRRVFWPPTWSMSSSEGPLVHRNSPRIIGITRMSIPEDLTLSRGYIPPQRETPSQKNHPLSQRYRSRSRNHALRGQPSQFSPGAIQELFTLRRNLTSSDKTHVFWQGLPEAWKAGLINPPIALQEMLVFTRRFPV